MLPVTLGFSSFLFSAQDLQKVSRKKMTFFNVTYSDLSSHRTLQWTSVCVMQPLLAEVQHSQRLIELDPPTVVIQGAKSAPKMYSREELRSYWDYTAGRWSAGRSLSVARLHSRLPLSTHTIVSTRTSPQQQPRTISRPPASSPTHGWNIYTQWNIILYKIKPLRAMHRKDGSKPPATDCTASCDNGIVLATGLYSFTFKGSIPHTAATM